MQITLNEQEIQEAVQQYIIGLGILAEGTNATVTLTGGGKGNNSADYGATLEFSKTRPQAAAPAQPVKREVTEVVAAREPVITPEPVSDKSEATPEVVADASVGKSQADTQASSQEPDVTEENSDNSPFKTVAEEGPRSKGVSLFNRDPA